MEQHFIGVDVGTGSARVGIFDAAGHLLASARRDIAIWREVGGIVEQSSEDIWRAICAAMREAMQQAAIAPETVGGIGFDATCSLVLLTAEGAPLAAGPSGEAQRNIIVWMDHRATDQARRINATGHPVLRYVGGRISPEMQTPKILWLKENQPETYRQAGHFLDLADYMTWRATGATTRSLCTVTCKWTYLAHDGGWNADYFRTIGLGELAEEGFARIGSEVADIASPLAGGLTPAAAADLGLRAGTAVGASLIDAHSGGVGTFAGALPDGTTLQPERQMALILGTSACAMILTREPKFVAGVWGPYFGAMVPGFWLLEGGQSAYGAALDHLVTLHPAHPALLAEAQAEGIALPVLLEREAIALAGSAGAAAMLAKAVQIVPDFLGNRAPHADPEASACISGLRLDGSRESLIRLYVAGLCGLCYGTRQIIAAATAEGITIDTLVVSGGAAQSPLLRRILSDATGCRVALPDSGEPVLLGAAIVGAVASGHHAGLTTAAAAMSRFAEVIDPAPDSAALHDAKYAAFQILQQADQRMREALRGI